MDIKHKSAGQISLTAKEIALLYMYWIDGVSKRPPCLDDKTLEYIEAQLITVKLGSIQFSLPLTLMQADRMYSNYKSYKNDLNQFFNDISNLQSRFYDEITQTVLHQVEKNYVSHYKQDTLFGEQVASAYPSAAHDIEQAGTCLSLGLGTACVFHCMRVMEIGLKACEGILGTGPNSNWGASIKSMTAALEANRSSIDKDTHLFYSEIIAHLSTVKNAWRNPSMHFDKKSYSTTEAEGILNAVKGFMVHLSTRLKEL